MNTQTILVIGGTGMLGEQVARQLLRDRFEVRLLVRSTLQLMRVMQRVGERGDPSEANEVLGAPTTTLRRWCEKQQARSLSSTAYPTELVGRKEEQQTITGATDFPGQ